MVPVWKLLAEIGPKSWRCLNFSFSRITGHFKHISSLYSANENPTFRRILICLTNIHLFSNPFSWSSYFLVCNIEDLSCVLLASLVYLHMLESVLFWRTFINAQWEITFLLSWVGGCRHSLQVCQSSIVPKNEISEQLSQHHQN